jgi:hypothetical protein
MYGELSEGKRSTRGQRSVTKDCLKVAEQDLGVDPSTLDTLAQDRSAWRSHVHSGADDFEKRRLTHACYQYLSGMREILSRTHRPDC